MMNTQMTFHRDPIACTSNYSQFVFYFVAEKKHLSYFSLTEAIHISNRHLSS